MAPCALIDLESVEHSTQVRFEDAQQLVEPTEQRQNVGVVPADDDEFMNEACRDDGV